MNTETDPHVFDLAADQTVAVGNRLAEADPEADLWDIADGLLAGAVHFWLYARQPCDRLDCEDCAPLLTAEQRLAALLKMTEEMAREGDYFHTPNDRNAGRA